MLIPFDHRFYAKICETRTICQGQSFYSLASFERHDSPVVNLASQSREVQPPHKVLVWEEAHLCMVQRAGHICQVVPCVAQWPMP